MATARRRDRRGQFVLGSFRFSKLQDNIPEDDFSAVPKPNFVRSECVDHHISPTGGGRGELAGAFEGRNGRRALRVGRPESAGVRGRQRVGGGGEEGNARALADDSRSGHACVALQPRRNFEDSLSQFSDLSTKYFHLVYCTVSNPTSLFVQSKH